MVSVSEKDYIVVRNGKKYSVVKVESIEDPMLNCITSDHFKQEVVIDAEKEVVANLGPQPAYGAAYGATVAPWTRTINHPIGDVHFYLRITKEEWTDIKQQLNLANSWLEEKGVDVPLEFFILPPKGKATGSLKISKDPLTTPHSMVIFDTKVVFGAFIHEMGKLLWDVLPDGNKLEVVEEFHKLVSLTQISPNDLQTIREELEASEYGIKPYYKEADEETRMMLKEIFGWIKKNHRLGTVHLDLQIRNRKSLEEVWPRSSLQLSNLEPSISELALKSPENLWCEGLRLVAEGVSIGRLEDLIVKCLGLCKT